MNKATYDIHKLKELAPAITGKTRTIGEGGLQLTIELILQTINDNLEKFSEFSNEINGGSLHKTAYNIWHFLKTETKYTKDTPGYEEIRSPQRLISDHIGDCDDYTIFAAAILKNLGYNPYLTVVAFNGSKNYQHIYVTVGNHIIDGVMKTFNEHPAGITKFLLIDLKGNHKEFFRNPKDLNMSSLVIQSLSGLPVNDQSLLINDEYSRLLGIGEQLSEEEKEDFNKLRILKVLNGADSPHRDFFIEILPEISGIDENMNVYFDDDEDRIEVENFLDEYLQLQGLGNLDELQGLFDRWKKNKPKRQARKKERKEKRKKFVQKIKDTRKKHIEKIKKVSKKVTDFTKKVSLAPARGAFLLLLKANFLKWGSRIWLSYLPENKAKEFGMDLNAYKKLVEFRKKLESFWKKSGGDIKAIKNAVSKRGAKKAKDMLGLSGLGVVATAAVGGSAAAASPFLAFLAKIWKPIKNVFSKLFKNKDKLKKLGDAGGALLNEYNEANTEDTTLDVLDDGNFDAKYKDDGGTNAGSSSGITKVLLPVGILAALAFLL